MGLLSLVLIVLVVLTAGYLLYGTLIARLYRLDDDTVTPAVARNDGVDFVPTRPFYLMGQHFSAIAAAGPIVGPVAACMAFGWGPCVLWILLGVIFIGAVHDFSALVASVRHGAHSIAEIARQHLGRRAYLALAAFIWLALLYVILAFTDVTAATFVGTSEEVAGLGGSFNKGGAVAAASMMYLAVALVMGFVQRFLKPPMWALTLVFVPATLWVIWLGTRVSTLGVFNHDAFSWQCAILVYCFVASLLPMWTLQQPRGYLGGFVLYLALAVGLVGIVIGGFKIEQPAFWEGLAGLGAFFGSGMMPAADGSATAIKPTQLLFPFLFVTIACGACSGFHGLVCGGTTSKQVAKESHCKPIAFGAMLLEGLVAVIALATVMVAKPESLAGKNPAVIYGDGIAAFLTTILGPEARVFALTFGTMAVATFVFDTLDVSTRLGRYLLQELLGAKGRAAGVAAAALTAGVPLLVLWG
ncbi:MAG: carbon starvation protein A, partial [Phycisphaerales bacterium]|nr:carbon starvation protein A [Phycisphaerales bacterium]